MLQIEQTSRTIPNNRTVNFLMPYGRLDMTTAWQFRLKLQDCLSRENPYVIINLSQVAFIDSSGLTALVAGMRDAKKIGGKFYICSIHRESRLVFEVTMMDSVFEIFKTQEDALAAIELSLSNNPKQDVI